MDYELFKKGINLELSLSIIKKPDETVIVTQLNFGEHLAIIKPKSQQVEWGNALIELSKVDRLKQLCNEFASSSADERFPKEWVARIGGNWIRDCITYNDIIDNPYAPKTPYLSLGVKNNAKKFSTKEKKVLNELFINNKIKVIWEEME